MKLHEISVNCNMYPRMNIAQKSLINSENRWMSSVFTVSNKTSLKTRNVPLWQIDTPLIHQLYFWTNDQKKSC
jgi:hypothetical protein